MPGPDSLWHSWPSINIIRSSHQWQDDQEQVNITSGLGHNWVSLGLHGWALYANEAKKWEAGKIPPIGGAL